MTSITRDELDALVAAARPLYQVTEAWVREEFETFLARWFGVGSVGVICPTIDGNDQESFAECFAEVGGLPLHPHQVLELERSEEDGSVVVRATLWTTADGLPYGSHVDASGEPVTGLADLAGRLL